jgi:hypothetical protein
MESGAALAHQDAPGVDPLPSETLDAQALRIRLAPVLGRRLTFFMSHSCS